LSLLEKITQKALDFRSIRVLLEGVKVTKEMERAALLGDRVRVKQLIKEQNTDLTTMGVQQLKKIAQGLGVINYSRLTRGQLIEELRQYDKRAVDKCIAILSRFK
jgi:hypothetical protein